MFTNHFSIKLQLGLKRLLDIIFGSLALVIWTPFLLIIAILIKHDSSGPILYRHKRIGKDGKSFFLYKFRTMMMGGDDTSYMNYLDELIRSSKQNPSTGKPYKKMKDDSRVTKVGHILRKYYLDELPQLVNVVKGDLSLVGPRPHVQFEVDNYTPDQYRRLTVKPGATGLWQTIGKADCTFNELLAYDLEYIDSWSLWLDIKIIFATVYIMMRGGEDFWTRADKTIPPRFGGGILRVKKSKAEKNLDATLPDNVNLKV